MVAVDYKVPLPASPPPSPPRGMPSANEAGAGGITTAVPSTSSKGAVAAVAAAHAAKSIGGPTPIPSPDVSHDDLQADGSSRADAVDADAAAAGGAVRSQLPRLTDFELIRVLGKGCAGRVRLQNLKPSRAGREGGGRREKGVRTDPCVTGVTRQAHSIGSRARDESHLKACRARQRRA